MVLLLFDLHQINFQIFKSQTCLQTDLNASLMGTLGAGGVDDPDGTGAGGGAGGEGAGAVDTFIPTTYVLKSNYEYMRPVVQIDADLSDKKATIKEIYIRSELFPFLLMGVWVI